MNAFEAYQLFQAIKLHFNGTYDFFRYNGKTNASEKSFETRKDKYHYHKLSKQENPKLLCVAGMIKFNGNVWVGQLFDEECQKAYQEMVGRRSNLKYTLQKDLSRYDSFDDMFLFDKKTQMPPILTDYKRGKVSIETLAIVTDICPVWDYWRSKVVSFIINNIQKPVENYRPFMEYNKKEFHDLLVDLLDNPK